MFSPDGSLGFTTSEKVKYPEPGRVPVLHGRFPIPRSSDKASTVIDTLAKGDQ
jgi:hypothetical protein